MGDHKATPVLYSTRYELDTDSAAFFKSVTGIRDDAELKEHILDVQAQAYSVAPYPCIRSFGFTKLKISKMPCYEEVLKLGREREGALFLDIGCCFGNDARKAMMDGFPAKQIIASDLRRELWDLGHVLFRSTPESFPATFVTGDALDPTFLSHTSDLEPTAEVNLSNITTLNELRGKVSVIWATSFFHLFSEKHQRQLAHALGLLLSPECGSIIFGSHVALPETGLLEGDVLGKEVKMFCHNPDSWEKMWVGEPASVDSNTPQGLEGPVFPTNSVKLNTKLCPVEAEGKMFYMLVWSITRL